MSLLFGDKFFVIGGGKQPVSVPWVFGFDANHPGAVSIVVDLLRRGGQGLIYGDHFAGNRREDLRNRFHRFYGAKALALSELAADFGKLDKHDVAKLLLGIAGNAHGGSFAVNFYPFVLTGVLQIIGISHSILYSPYFFGFLQNGVGTTWHFTFCPRISTYTAEPISETFCGT